MRSLLPEHYFFIDMIVGVLAITIITGSKIWYLNLIPLSIFCGIMVLTVTWRDRAFYLTCAGIPLVVVCGIQNIWAGLFVTCMLAGIVCGAFGLLRYQQDLKPFAFFCIGSFLITLLIQVTNHVLIPFLVMGIIAAAVLLIQSVRIYQLKKHYSGA